MMTTNDRAKTLILSAIIEHMPETASASGWCSLVDLAPWIASMSDRFPFADRPNLGLSALVAWLKEQGLFVGMRAAKALRANWIRDELRHATN